MVVYFKVTFFLCAALFLTNVDNSFQTILLFHRLGTDSLSFCLSFPPFFFPFKCSQSCWCILAESLKLMPFLKLNMSPDVCPPCCFHTAGCLQCSFWEQCRGWKWHTSLASLRIHSYSHKTHECCNFNDGFCSWLGRNQAQGCPRWEEALLMPPCERHFGSFPDFWE